MSALPRYDQLPVVEGMPPHSAWGLWGEDDEVGAINLLTQDRVKDGIACARQGKVFPLNWELEMPNPSFYGRGPLVHTVTGGGDGHDDHLDSFYPQQSSQWDALCHVGHSDYGYYNGRSPSDFTGKPGAKNGVEHWARRGIVGRGILLDAARHFEAAGKPLAPNETHELSPAELLEIAQAQGVEIRQGDIVLLRTGWMAWYESRSQHERDEIAELASGQKNFHVPGFASGQEMARFFWDTHIAAAATDSSTFEAWPHAFTPGEYLHMDVLALLGIPIGELWFLDALAADCASDGIYEFLLTSAPLNVVGGVGSPPNALAIK